MNKKEKKKIRQQEEIVRRREERKHQEKIRELRQSAIEAMRHKLEMEKWMEEHRQKTTIIKS